MRHIDLSNLQVPADWLSESERALRELTEIVQEKTVTGQIKTCAGDVRALREVICKLDDTVLDSELSALRALFDGSDDEIELAVLRSAVEAVEQLDSRLDISAEIDHRAASTWRALKPYLSNLVEGIMPSDDHPDGKCWYCESRYRMRMLEVDHYRPKAAVRGDGNYNSKTGYWWLAFDHNNFRLSCQTCNRLEKGDDNVTRGKGTWFPLADENKRAHNAVEVENETPLLLDPTNASDVHLLVFLADGRVEPSVSDPTSLDYQRAKRSIDVYHLNAPFDKRLARCREIQSLIVEADLAYRTLVASENEAIAAEHDALFVKKIQAIVEFLRPQSAYSMAALAEAKRHSPTYEWVQEIIE